MHAWFRAAAPLLPLNDKCTALGKGNLNGIFISALELSSSHPDIWGWRKETLTHSYWKQNHCLTEKQNQMSCKSATRKYSSLPTSQGAWFSPCCLCQKHEWQTFYTLNPDMGCHMLAFCPLAYGWRDLKPVRQKESFSSLERNCNVILRSGQICQMKDVWSLCKQAVTKTCSLIF